MDKVAEMLESKRLATLGREVKATAVMAALEAAQVPDARRDPGRRCAATRRSTRSRRPRSARWRSCSGEPASAPQALKAEMDGYLRAKNAEIEELKTGRRGGGAQAFAEAAGAQAARGSRRLHDVVAHFIEGADNPITAGAPKAPSKPSPA